MDADELQLLIAGYVLCDLSPEEMIAFEQRLAHDPNLALAVAQLQHALEAAYDTPEVAPPEHLKSAILAAHSTASPPQRRQNAPARTRSTGRWTRWLGATAAALIAGLGFNNYRLWQEVKTLRSEAPTSTLAFTLQPTDTALAASAQVVVNPDTLEAALTVTGLPPLPPGKVYVLWTVVAPNAPFTTDQKNAILTQVFTVDGEGQLSQEIPVPKVYRDPATVKAIAVTIESADAPQRHVAAPILIERL